MPRTVPSRLAAALLCALLPGVVPAAAAERPDLLFEADFNYGGDVTAMGFKYSGNPEVPLVEVAGQRAAKFVIDRHASKVSYRTEIVPNRLPASHFGQGMFAKVGGEYWYGMRTLLPDDWRNDRAPEIVAQFHSVPDQGEGARNPSVALTVVPDSRGAGRWVVRIRADDRPMILGSGERRYRYAESFDLGPVGADLGAWVDWVWHVTWNYDGKGFLRLYKNGRLVLDHKGGNCFNDAAGGPYLKLGLYKWEWDESVRSTGTDARTLYFDDIRIAGGQGSYASVAPAGAVLRSSATPTETPGGNR